MKQFSLLLGALLTATCVTSIPTPVGGSLSELKVPSPAKQLSSDQQLRRTQEQFEYPILYHPGERYAFAMTENLLNEMKQHPTKSEGKAESQDHWNRGYDVAEHALNEAIKHGKAGIDRYRGFVDWYKERGEEMGYVRRGFKKPLILEMPDFRNAQDNARKHLKVAKN